MESIQLSDITIVASLEETVILCVKNEDIDNPNCEAIQYDLGYNTYSIDKIQKFLKFTPFSSVDTENEKLQDFFKNWIYRKLTDEVLIESLKSFTSVEVFLILLLSYSSQSTFS